MSEIKEEPISLSINGMKRILFQMEKCVCKIYLKSGHTEIGYFYKIPFKNNKLLPVLITNKHVLNDIDDNKIIKLTANNEEKRIKIDNSRKKYINPDINIVIIEIKPNKDKIYDYLELDEILNKKEEKESKSIYSIFYLNEEINLAYGSIKGIINDKKISNFSPILSLKTFKVIGIHYYNSKNYITFIKSLIEEFEKYYNIKYKNEINIIYKTDKEGTENIFGDKFVENNKYNIELIINGNKNNLVKEYKLKKGRNNVKIIIKNKITNLEYMFYDCKLLKNVKELEYLDTKDINNFTSMFNKCSLLSDINGLENWNVLNGNNFSYMFNGCSSLSDINGLENWNVSNGKNFSGMFSFCSSLSDINPLGN